METFTFSYHTPQDEYPGGSTVKFGRGYRFAARPSGPPEIVCHLNFPAMFFFQVNAGDPVDTTFPHPLNIALLESFYARHQMYEPFVYPHPTRGNIIARFNKPLVMPKTMKSNPGEVGGIIYGASTRRLHQVEPFDIEFVLQP